MLRNTYKKNLDLNQKLINYIWLKFNFPTNISYGANKQINKEEQEHHDSKIRSI